MKKKYIVGNWKMNTSIGEAIVLAKVISRRAEDFKNIKIVLAPPFVWLTALKEELSPRSNNLFLGAQNCAWKNKGAFTGEVSPTMLTNLVDYVILGHSERRRIFLESDAMIADKVRSALENDLTPIVCVGELESKRGEGVDKQIVNQMRHILDSVEKKELEKIIFAYEPLWAIGTGKAASPRYTATVIDHLRQEIESRFGPELAEDVSFLYGGSVTAENIKGYLDYDTINGALIGGASLIGREFIKICSFVSGEN